MKVHVITGGGSGMGLEFAKRIKDGLVIISGRGEEKLQKAVEELKAEGVNADYKTCDITVKDEVDDLLKYAKGKGELMTVINSAGVSGASAKAELTFKIDLLGTKIITDSAYEYLEKGGVLILLASMMGHAVPPNEAYDKYLNEISEEGVEALAQIVQGDGNAAYNMSKRGVLLTVQNNADRFGEKGLRIMSVSPGIIMTPMAEAAAESHPEAMEFLKSVTPAQRTGKPEDVANMVEFLISDKASFMTGSDVLVDGGLKLNLSELAKLKQ